MSPRGSGPPARDMLGAHMSIAGGPFNTLFLLDRSAASQLPPQLSRSASP